MALDNFFRKLEAIEMFDIESETISIIKEHSYYITGLLRLQLQSGKDANDENVTIFGRDFYSDATIQDKRYNGVGLGKETDFITNYSSGSFYMSLKTVVDGRVFRTESDLPYFSDILKRSGSVIMKLNKKHLQEFSNEILIPELKRRFNQKVK